MQYPIYFSTGLTEKVSRMEKKQAYSFYSVRPTTITSCSFLGRIRKSKTRLSNGTCSISSTLRFVRKWYLHLYDKYLTMPAIWQILHRPAWSYGGLLHVRWRAKPCVFRLFLPRPACYMLACHYRSSRNGPKMRKTWYRHVIIIFIY